MEKYPAYYTCHCGWQLPEFYAKKMTAMEVNNSIEIHNSKAHSAKNIEIENGG